MPTDLQRTLRGAFPGPGLEPDAETRTSLADLGHTPVRYGAATPSAEQANFAATSEYLVLFF
jgi:hypothetical protein